MQLWACLRQTLLCTFPYLCLQVVFWFGRIQPRTHLYCLPDQVLSFSSFNLLWPSLVHFCQPGEDVACSGPFDLPKSIVTSCWAWLALDKTTISVTGIPILEDMPSQLGFLSESAVNSTLQSHQCGHRPSSSIKSQLMVFSFPLYHAHNTTSSTNSYSTALGSEQEGLWWFEGPIMVLRLHIILPFPGWRVVMPREHTYLGTLLDHNLFIENPAISYPHIPMINQFQPCKNFFLCLTSGGWTMLVCSFLGLMAGQGAAVWRVSVDGAWTCKPGYPPASMRSRCVGQSWRWAKGWELAFPMHRASLIILPEELPF